MLLHEEERIGGRRAARGTVWGIGLAAWAAGASLQRVFGRDALSYPACSLDEPSPSHITLQERDWLQHKLRGWGVLLEMLLVRDGQRVWLL